MESNAADSEAGAAVGYTVTVQQYRPRLYGIRSRHDAIRQRYAVAYAACFFVLQINLD